MTTNTITPEQAQAVLDAVKARWASWLEYTQPMLLGNYEGRGHWAILWEDGPRDWALRFTQGGYSEEEAAMAAAAAEEFDIPYDGPVIEKPTETPGVDAEPIYTFALGLYPA